MLRILIRIPGKMKKPFWLGIIICLHTELLQAQNWSESDSIWLADLLAGKDTLHINPEFQKAIRNGTFINLEEPAGTMQMAPAPLPITRDFSAYLHDPDSSVSAKVALKDLPPAVFMRYGLDKPLPFNGIHTNAFTPSTPFTGHPRQSLVGSQDFMGLLFTAFSPHYRQLQKNKKRATAWKTYNSLPTMEVHRKQKAFRAAHPEQVQKTDSAAQDTLRPRRASFIGPPTEAEMAGRP